MVPVFDEMNFKNREQVVFSHSYEKRTPRDRMVEKMVIKGINEINQLRNVYLPKQNPMINRDH